MKRAVILSLSFLLAAAGPLPVMAGPADYLEEASFAYEEETAAEEEAPGQPVAFGPGIEEWNDEVPDETLPGAEEIGGEIFRPTDSRFAFIPSDGSVYTDGENVFRMINDPMHGNEGWMRSSRSEGNPWENDWEAVTFAVQDFLVRHDIGSKETVFEKEIAVIRGLVAECTYEIAEDFSRYTAYSCLVDHRAQCAGYADAFMHIMRAAVPGIDVRFVHSSYHAWNMINLDGSWYHVDVTWEDDDTTGDLVNRFINLDDNAAEVQEGHHWVREDSGEPAVLCADGYRYGPMTVQYYINSGYQAIELSPDFYSFTVPAEGTTTGVLVENIATQLKETSSRGGHIARFRLNGLSYGQYKDRLRKLMQDVTQEVRTNIAYLAEPAYLFRDTETEWQVREAGTQISVILHPAQ